MLSGDMSEQAAFELAYSSWPTTPLFHYSEGIGDTRNHADYAVSTPNSYGKQVYFDVELKAKDWAIYKIMENV
jgi:hypothetical protein